MFESFYAMVQSQASQRVKEEKMRAESNFEAKATAVKVNPKP